MCDLVMYHNKVKYYINFTHITIKVSQEDYSKFYPSIMVCDNLNDSKQIFVEKLCRVLCVRHVWNDF
jgi:hypothetical protein